MLDFKLDPKVRGWLQAIADRYDDDRADDARHVLQYIAHVERERAKAEEDVKGWRASVIRKAKQVSMLRNYIQRVVATLQARPVSHEQSQALFDSGLDVLEKTS